MESKKMMAITVVSISREALYNGSTQEATSTVRKVQPPESAGENDCISEAVNCLSGIFEETVKNMPPSIHPRIVGRF